MSRIIVTNDIMTDAQWEQLHIDLGICPQDKSDIHTRGCRPALCHGCTAALRRITQPVAGEESEKR